MIFNAYINHEFLGHNYIFLDTICQNAHKNFTQMFIWLICLYFSLPVMYLSGVSIEIAWLNELKDISSSDFLFNLLQFV